jgi:DNA-binding transcriptional LysR family regulator
VELRHLRYFVAVAEMENVSRAATQKLHVAQPSLSRQIRDLEDEVGVQLLERTAKSVRLTDSGRAFVRYSHFISDAAVSRNRSCVRSGRLRDSRKATNASSSCGLSELPKAGMLVPPLTMRMTRLSRVNLSAM